MTHIVAVRRQMVKDALFLEPVPIGGKRNGLDLNRRMFNFGFYSLPISTDQRFPNGASRTPLDLWMRFCNGCFDIYFFFTYRLRFC